MKWLRQWIYRYSPYHKKKKARISKELQQLEKQLLSLQKAKQLNIKEQHFEAAKWYREKEHLLLDKINRLKAKTN